MSLTSQLKDKSSPVREFFEKYENNDGANECLALLQSTRPTRPLSFTPGLRGTHAVIGTAADYLLRYTFQGNSLLFENTIAYSASKLGMSTGQMIADGEYRYLDSSFFQSLFEIGKFYLDGRNATDENSVYSATALAVLDGWWRSSSVPKVFFTPVSNETKLWVHNQDENSPSQKSAWYLFDFYYQSLGGKLYAEDISELINQCLIALHNRESEIFKASIIVGNDSLSNSRLVGGADFDCVIEYNSRQILTDIKTTIKPLTIAHLRQLLGYALLYEEDKDNFKFTDIGIYHSRSVSFRYLPVGHVVKICLPNFISTQDAREVYISKLKQSLSTRNDIFSIFARRETSA